MPIPDDRRGRILREGLSCVKLHSPPVGAGGRGFRLGKGEPVAVEPETIRNVCLIGNRGGGKTSIAEGMIGLASGRSGPAGGVFDYTDEETERGMTLGMSVANLEWKGRQVNVLDTPGDGGFIGDAFIAQRVADCAILVVHAQDPIQVVTERVWRRGEREGIPHLIVVNHLDRERTDFGGVIGQLRARFGQAVVPLNLPIGHENDLSGIYGLLSGTAFVDGEQSVEIPEGMEVEVDEAKTQLFEAIAASAERMIGIDRLLDVIAGSAPSPADRSRWVTQEGQEVPCDSEGPFAAYAFKTYVDPYAGRLSVLRIVSGRCRSDEALQTRAPILQSG